MDTLPTDLRGALPPADGDSDSDTYFQVDKGIDRQTLLEVYDEVVDGARTVLAPFGLPTVLKKHCPAPLLLDRLRPAFDLLLDAASEAAYARRGLTEASVAVAVHYWLEEAGDERVRAALQGMQNALEEVVSLSDVVEVTPLPPPPPPTTHEDNAAAAAAATAEQPAQGGGGGTVPTPAGLVAEMRRLASALAAVGEAYCRQSQGAVLDGEGAAAAGSGGGVGAGGVVGSPSSQSSSSSLAAALVGGPWPAGVKRRWMARLLGAVAPRGKAAAVPWATGAALREVYASSSSGSNKKGSSSDKTEGGEGGGKPSKESGGGSGSSAEEEGVESVHARCLTPVMLAGGDALVAALGGLEAADEKKEGKGGSTHSSDSDSRSSSEEEGLEGLEAFGAFAAAVADAGRLVEVHADLEEAEERLREGCDALAPLVEAGLVPGSVLAWAEVRRAGYLKEAHELEGAMEALDAAIEADPQCGPAYLGRAQLNRIFSQHNGQRRKLRRNRKELQRRGRGEDDVDASGGSGSDGSDGSDAGTQAEEAAVLGDLERAYALDGLKTPAELQLLESALKDALRSAAMETLEERLAQAAQQASSTLEANALPPPPQWLAESYFASFHDSDLLGGEEEIIRPSACRPPPSPLSPLVTHARSLRSQHAYAQAIALLRSLIHERRKAAAAGGEDGEGERADLGWLENEWGSYCYLMGDLRGAEEAFARALELDPGHINSLIKLGEVLSDVGRAEEGLALLDQAVQRTEMRNGDALLHRGQVKLTQENIGGAVRDLRRAVHVDERPPPVAYACLGTALFKLDDTGESAQEALAEAAERHPESLEVLLYHGDVLAQRGDLAGAMRRFHETAKADPTCPLPFVNAARAYLSVRDYPQAERHLAKALSLDPACGASHLDMGQLHVQRGETAKAEAALARALAQARYLPEILDALVFKRLAELQRRYHPVEGGGAGDRE